MKTYWNESRQSVIDVQFRNFALELFPVTRLLDSDGCQILRSHFHDGRQVVARGHEEVDVLLEVHIGQPHVDDLVVGQPRLDHVVNVERANGVLDGARRRAARPRRPVERSQRRGR